MTSNALIRCLLCAATLIIVTANVWVHAAAAPVLIPKPGITQPGAGTFVVNAQTRILIQPANVDLKPLAEYLQGVLAPALGGKRAIEELAAGAALPENAIVLSNLNPPGELGAEGYVLTVAPAKGVLLRAGNEAGLFYGIQTLRQLLPVAIETPGAKAKWIVPSIIIRDVPRFPRRGLLLDVARHFYTIADIKRFIDVMARYKLNSLHLHLTDDQGWRVEIKKYPRLTEVGAFRKGENKQTYPGGPQGGFYTQDEIRELVAYAAGRFVTLVPEVEMPGHAGAALAAYPELSCTGGPFEVSTHWGVHDDVFCAGNEKTTALLQDVLTEVLELFPSKDIHLGGDEVRKGRWQACPRCQARIKAEGLKDEKALQSAFMRRMVKFLNDHGRRAICWDEVLEEGLTEGIVVQEWRSHKPAPEGLAARAAALGMDVVVSPAPQWYLDMPLIKNQFYNWGWAGTSNLADAYGLDPMPRGLDPALHKHILGGEGCLWTERIPPRRLEYFAWPRGLAIAEVLWSPPEGREFAEFYGRVRAHLPRLDAMGVKYGPAMPDAYDPPRDPGQDY